MATNRRARHDFEILETLECGIVLVGSEVKSLREGTAQIAGSYARVDDGELWIFQMHVPPVELRRRIWQPRSGSQAQAPRSSPRTRTVEAKGRRPSRSTIVPLKLYFKEGRAKVEIALARGRKQQDRRQALAKRDAERDIARAARHAEKLG